MPSRRLWTSRTPVGRARQGERVDADLAAGITEELRAFVAAAGHATRAADRPATSVTRAASRCAGRAWTTPSLRADLVERAIDGLRATDGACAWLTRGGDLGTTDADAAWFAAARAGFARHGLTLPAFVVVTRTAWVDLVSGEHRQWRRVRTRRRGGVSAHKRPGVHRLVGVHQLAVLLQRQPQRLGAVGALLLARGDLVDVPRGTVATEDAALLDDPEQPRGLVGLDAPALQPRVGHRQQPAQHQLGRGHLADAGPVDARADAVLGAPRGSSPRPPRTTSATTAAGRPRPGCAPGRSRRRRWPSCRSTVGPAASTRFSTRRWGTPVDDVVDRPVPAVDGAVVQLQLRERRGAAVLEHLQRVLVVGDREQRREVAHVLLEQVEDRVDPALAEPHPRPHALLLELLAAGVGGLLEQRDPGLLPQLLAEQVRRVGADRELDAADRLRGVPVRREVVRAHLGVQLGARAGGLRHDRLRGRPEPLGAVDVDDEVLTPRGQDLVAEQLVARVRADVRRAQVTVLEGRQDADHHHVGVDLAGLALGVVEAAAQVVLEAGDAARAEAARQHVDLEVELRELGLEVGLAIASSASALFSDGCPSSSTRLNSISIPVIGFSMSK